ncbi:MAG: DUF4149 domain-containing protein [Ramlibacter sp.]|jgi:hypothetical protein|nr:DUF4149 domain-containing protein [Ramlibacter sp.]
MRDRLPVMFAALWWGSLTAVGFVVVPQLFAHLPTPAMAGAMAARLFTAQTWVSVACGVLLLLASRERGGGGTAAWAKTATPFIVAGLLLALLVEFAVAPRIVARENLKLWHGVGSAMYLLQWLCAGAALWKASRSG